MKIAICDDDMLFAKKAKEMLYTYSNEHNWESVVEIYATGIDLINSKQKFDIILMDYQMEKLNGIDTAKLLRESSNPCSCIIFVTNYPEIAIEAYSVDTFRFVVKKEFDSSFFLALDNFKNKKDFDYIITVKSKNETMSLNTRTISLVEANNKHLILYRYDDEPIKTRLTLGKVSKLLPYAYFVQTHKSYIVNCRQIKVISRSHGVVEQIPFYIPLSRSYSRHFITHYHNFLRDQL